MNIPKIGDKIYVPSAFYVGHGEDDIVGGLATVRKVDINECKNPHNRIFVSVNEVPVCSYNWAYLCEEQDELSKEFGNNAAHPDPDYTDYGERI